MINLPYVRAAIHAATGTWLTLRRTRELMVEEGLITQQQADLQAQLFVDYSEFYSHDTADTPAFDLDDQEGLPD